MLDNVRVPLVSLKMWNDSLAKCGSIIISGVLKVVGEKKKEKKTWTLPEIQRRTRRTGQGRFLVKKLRNGKLACRGYSMITIREWFASGALKANKLWWHRMCGMWRGGTLLGEWKLIQASAFWGFLAQMASALKIKCPTLQADVKHLMGHGKQNKVHCFAKNFHTMLMGPSGFENMPLFSFRRAAQRDTQILHRIQIPQHCK